MSPGSKQSFEKEWPALSRKLRLMLARKRVPACQHDDLIQETALRLMLMWDRVDPTRSPWPLTVTIALNLLRDGVHRNSRDDLVSEVPDVQREGDVADIGIARVELERVRHVLEDLSPNHRAALLKEVGAHADSRAPDGANDKMVRMRARQRLRSALGKVSGLAALRFRRVNDFFEGLIALRDGGLSFPTCVACLIAGVGASVAVPTPITPHVHAEARPDRSVLERDTWNSALITTDDGGWLMNGARAVSTGSTVDHDGGLLPARHVKQESSSPSPRKKARAKDRTGTQSEQPDLIRSVPMPTDTTPLVEPESLPGQDPPQVVPNGDDSPTVEPDPVAVRPSDGGDGNGDGDDSGQALLDPAEVVEDAVTIAI